MPTAIIADTQPLLRSAVRQLLTELGLEVIAEFDDGAEALHGTLRLAPTLLILDLALPRLGGLEVLGRLRQQQNGVKTLVITAQSSEHFAGLSLNAGADGFIGKQESIAEVRQGLQAVLGGHRYFPSHALGTVASSTLVSSEQTQLATLSPREVTVLNYLGQGLSNKQIADSLLLSDRTVSTYKARLLQKLNVGSLAELLELAWRRGLLATLPAMTVPAANDTAEELRQVFDALPLPVALRDREGRLLIGNRAYLEFHGITQEQAQNMRLVDSNRVDPDDAERMQQGYLAAVARAQPFSKEVAYRHQGQRRVSRAWGVPWLAADGTLVGMLCSSVDISAQEQELAVMANAEQAHQATRKRRTLFLHDVGELAKPLITTLQQQLGSLAEQVPQAPEVALAQQALGKLNRELDALLDLLRIERGTLSVVPEVVDLRRLSEQLLAPVPLQSNDVDACCWLDPGRYQQVLVALLQYLAVQGVTELSAQCQAQTLAHAQMAWQLEIGPRGLPAAGEPYVPGPEQLTLNLALASRLTGLLGGELSLYYASPHVQIVLHLPQALPR